jgi:hypothetical protein
VIPDSVIRLGDAAFYSCTTLTDVTIGKGVTSIGNWCFKNCPALTNLTMGNSVTSIGDYAFYACTHLPSVTLPATLGFIGEEGFGSCNSLTAIYFQGDAPTLGSTTYAFDHDSATIYYKPGTTGWSSSFGGLSTAMWYLPNPVILNTGFIPADQTNSFGFIVSWATNLSLVVEGCTDLASSNWSPVSTNALTNGWFYFSDPEWTNYRAGFYRIRSP